MRFMPEPSPESMGASAPASSDAMNEDTRWMRAVAAYALGSVSANARICGPVKRSNAREPVLRASSSAPPTAASISRHSTVVLESIHTGDERPRNPSAICASKRHRARARVRREKPRSFRYTLPCCCAEPEIAGSRAISRGWSADELAHHAVERFDPHQRRRDDDGRVGAAQDAVSRAVLPGIPRRRASDCSRIDRSGGRRR